jgi:hypothetical protein
MMQGICVCFDGCISYSTEINTAKDERCQTAGMNALTFSWDIPVVHCKTMNTMWMIVKTQLSLFATAGLQF